MSCGCKNNNAKPNVSLPQLEQKPRQPVASKLKPDEQISYHAKAAMCQACPKAKRIGKNAVGCTLLNKNLKQILFSKEFVDCPLGHFTADNKYITHLGVYWHGVPEYIRWQVSWHKKKNVYFKDCGCSVKLKASWLGEILEPWLEGISTLRTRFFFFIDELYNINKVTHEEKTTHRA